MAEEESCPRGISAEDSSGGHSEEERSETSTDEHAGLRTTDRSKVAAEKRLFEQKVEREVDRRVHALGVREQTHDTCSELAGAPTERARGTGTKP